MIKNRDDPLRGQPRDDPYLSIKTRGDPGMFRHARDNSTCNVFICSKLIQFKKLKGGEVCMGD